jgi:hypothetical protein
MKNKYVIIYKDSSTGDTFKTNIKGERNVLDYLYDLECSENDLVGVISFTLRNSKKSDGNISDKTVRSTYIRNLISSFDGIRDVLSSFDEQKIMGYIVDANTELLTREGYIKYLNQIDEVDPMDLDAIKKIIYQTHPNDYIGELDWIDTKK